MKSSSSAGPCRSGKSSSRFPRARKSTPRSRVFGNLVSRHGVHSLMRRRLWLRLPIFFAGVAAGGIAQVETILRHPPSFEPGRVQLANSDRAVPLAPGLLISIYGSYLGPLGSCIGSADTPHRETASPLLQNQAFVNTLIYPKELCDTRVLVAGVPAGLLYVQDRQINFKVPLETPLQGTAEVLVIRQGMSSKPVTLPLGLDPIALSLDGPAAVGLPVWLKVRLPYEQEGSLQYPFGIQPANFVCNVVEVRRDGRLLPRFANLKSQALRGIAMSGPICGQIGQPSRPQYSGRIPIHLQYRFDHPGVYEVRYTRRTHFIHPSAPPDQVSAWTRIEILPGGPRQRARWLAEKSGQAPTDANELLSDFLPSILGIPDEQSLSILREYLYHPDRLVREYAMYGLTYWPQEKAAESVWELMRVRGPTDEALRFLGSSREFAAAHADEIVGAAIPFLQSDAAVLLRGAVMAVS